MKAPCKDCGQRKLGCHDRCEAYQTYLKRCEAAREKRREHSILFTCTRDGAHRMHTNHRVSTHKFAEGVRKDGKT